MTSKHKFPKQRIIPYEIQTQKRLKKKTAIYYDKTQHANFQGSLF